MMPVNTRSIAITSRKPDQGFNELQELQAKYLRTPSHYLARRLPIGITEFCDHRISTTP